MISAKVERHRRRNSGAPGGVRLKACGFNRINQDQICRVDSSRSRRRPDEARRLDALRPPIRANFQGPSVAATSAHRCAGRAFARFLRFAAWVMRSCGGVLE